MEIDETKHADVAALVAIIEILEPLTPTARARVLGAVTLVSAPCAFNDAQWLALIHRAQQQEELA